MPDPEDLPLECALAGRESDAVPVSQVAQQLGAVDTLGGADGGDDGGESSSGEKSSSPIALIPARAARPSRMWRSKRRLEPVLEQHPERDVEPLISDTAGVNAASKTSCAFLVAAPVEVEAARRRQRVPERVGDGGDREAGRAHERLL